MKSTFNSHTMGLYGHLEVLLSVVLALPRRAECRVLLEVSIDFFSTALSLR